MGHPLVTIIVPIYNVEKYIDECLQSLENQTFKDIEVILVNDGSTDTSREIAQRYVERNENFQLIDRKNGGASAARNVGIKYATGKYLYFLDSDDYILNGAIEELMQKAESERLDVLKFSAYTFEDGNNEKMEWLGYRYKGNYPDVYDGVSLLQRMKANRDNIPSCCMIVARKDLVKKNSIWFHEGITHEDDLFHWMLLILSKRTAILNKPLYFRRMRKDSTSQKPDYYERWKSTIIGANEAHKYFCKHAELHNTGIEWYYFTTLRVGINDGYMLMDRTLRNTREALQLRENEKKILRDLNFGKSFPIFIYTIHPVLYKPFRIMLKGIKKIFCKWQAIRYIKNVFTL